MKNKTQSKILENEFIKEREWSKDKIIKLSKLVGLSQGQIYKWNWDRKHWEKKNSLRNIYNNRL